MATDPKAARAASLLASQAALDAFLSTYATLESKRTILERLRPYLKFEPKEVTE